ncbi:MAG: hypothetical protein DIZ80_17170 [endosymbiont of Galathealinum brachiosum]|uniref:Uncharacterized protein n=1 Tax=endosymbiont of Galathealinum brachiosum TaxID=2200906 RepID=A0A370D8Z4_9GAMM|nr:MAG: hypothetical protein DIZ80_17170 [endosymbiont of Galathealinum brachiosum]
MTLKNRFMEAVSSGDLGEVDDFGVIVSLKEFKSYFKDVKSDYINSFLPAAVIETGQYTPTHTKYLFRIRKGTYRVHPDAIDEHNESGYIKVMPMQHLNNKVEEAIIQYQNYRIN